MSEILNFPRQQLSFKAKNKKWRKQCVDWADNRSFQNHNLVRKSVMAKKINYDLLNGKLHMPDLHLVLNPDNIEANYVPTQIQHYPIMNSKLHVLKGEEAKRIFDYKVIITNPNAISEIEKNKKQQIVQKIQELATNTAQSEEEMQQELAKYADFMTYEWQDMREVRGNNLLKHYIKEHNIPVIFNSGFMDAMTVGEEMYICDIIGGEPVVERLNPLKTHVFRSGYSNRIEDADVIILEDYWSPGRIIDTFHEVLTAAHVKKLDEMGFSGAGKTDSMDNIDERYSPMYGGMEGVIDNSERITIPNYGDIEPVKGADAYFGLGFDDGFEFNATDYFTDETISSSLPYDVYGNVRVLRVFWKSKRKIKKVKSYDPLTGDTVYNFYPETYVLNEDMGEEEEIFYINEAWEGTKIGSDIYVNMRPRPVQYNRLSNPSRCHFGIIGSIYNLNDDKPFSLVDMMKQYNYLYDVIHDRLNKMISRNWGKIITLDLAKVPKGWDVEQWMHHAKVNGLAVVDSFKEGNYGAATGKIAGALNNASSGVIDAEFGNSIQMLINLLEFIKNEMSEVAGISRQREGQVSNRETVGGVERATLQSSHITEWLFTIHDDLKRRVLECFLETAKIALKGRSKKFQYLLSDGASKIMDIEGDEFADADYGLLVDNSSGTLELSQKLDMLAQAALQNQTLNFATIMKLYGSSSIAEKQRMVENNETKLQEQRAQEQQQAIQQQQQEAQMRMQEAQMKMEQENMLNERDNETKILIATINAQTKMSDVEMPEDNGEDMAEKRRQFDEKMILERDKFEFDKTKHKEDNQLKDTISKRQAAKSAASKSNN